MNRRKYFTLIIPVLFLLVGIHSILFYNKRLIFDSWMFVNSVREIWQGFGYVNIAAEYWPPLYPLTMVLLSPFLEITLSGKIISITSASLFLFSLKYFKTENIISLAPIFFIQLVFVLSPRFLIYSVTAENHMLYGFLFTVSIYLGLNHFKQEDPTFPYMLLLFSVFASLTRYSALSIIFSFVLVHLFLNKTKVNWALLNKYILYFFYFFSPWLFYNYFNNGNIISGYKWQAIGTSFINYNLFNMSDYEWIFIKSFDYGSVFNIFYNHPEKFFWHILYSTLTNLEAMFLYYPPLGLFTPIVGLGFIGLFFLYKRAQWSFVLLNFFFLVIVWNQSYGDHLYLLFFVSVLAVIGVNFLWLLSEKIIQNTFSVQHGGTLLLVLFFSFGLFMEFNNRVSYFKRIYLNGFRENPVKIHTYQELLKLQDKTQNETPIRIISWSLLSPVVYQTGFEPVVSPFPKSSSMEIFCFWGLSEDRLRFHKQFNYPSILPPSKYVPADYILVRPKLKHEINKRPHIRFKDLKDYIEKVDWWQTKISWWKSDYRIWLYKIKKRELPCN